MSKNIFSNLKKVAQIWIETEEKSDDERLINYQLKEIHRTPTESVEIQRNTPARITTIIVIASLIVALVSVATTIFSVVNSSRREAELLLLQLDSQPLRYRVEWETDCNLVQDVNDCNIVLHVDAGRINNLIVIRDGYISQPMFLPVISFEEATIGVGESITLNRDLSNSFEEAIPHLESIPRWGAIAPFPVLSAVDSVYNHAFVYIETTAGERILDMIYFNIAEDVVGNFIFGRIQNMTRANLYIRFSPQFFLYTTNIPYQYLRYFDYFNLINRFQVYGLLD